MRKPGLLLAGAALALAACQTGPSAPVITLATPAEVEPVGVAAPLGRNLSEGLTVNDWGGEIPQTKPPGAVSSDGLGDLD